MAIDPTKSSGAHPGTGGRIDQAGGDQSARQGRAIGAPAAGDAAPIDDTVPLSAEACEAHQAGATTSASGLGQDRLHEIQKRLSSGYYDNPPVIDEVARQVSDELGKTAPGSW